MPAKYVIGVDGGTESLRAAVFDAADGTMVGMASSPYPTHYPHPGWAEQNPADWWAALGEAVRGAVAAAAVPADQVLAMCIDTTCCTVVTLDIPTVSFVLKTGVLSSQHLMGLSSGHALRPALLWMDQRSGEQTKQVLATGDAALQVNSAGWGPVSAEWMVPKALWIKQHEPHTYDAAAHICEYQDYMNLHLTGRMCGSVNTMSVRWHYSADTGKPASMLAALGLSDLLDKWPRDVLALGDVVGGLTAAAASHLGLPADMPVAQGGADSFIGMVGLGVVRPGAMALLTGSSHLQLGMLDKSLHGRGIFGTYSSAVVPGLHVVEGGQTSTGSAVAWLRRALVGHGVSYAELDREAADVPPGCEGLLCLDHFQGNRTPHTDPLSRGALVGLTLKHSRGHVFRALLEGVAFGTELVLESMRANGYAPQAITIAGGATKSELWLQLHADVSNLPLVVTSNPEAPMLGCAILAATAAGVHAGGLVAAADAMVHVERTILPNAAAHQQYRQHYENYKALYPALKAAFHSVAVKRAPARGASEQMPAREAPASAASVPPAASASTSSAKPPRPCGIIAPSILAADFGDLAAEVRRVLSAGADWVHVDIIDGTTCDNVSFGPPVVASLRRHHPDAFLDCHLTVADPSKYVQALGDAGASSITFYAEVLPGASALKDGQRDSGDACPANTSEGDACSASTSRRGEWLAAAKKLAGAIRSRGMRAAVALAPSTAGDGDVLTLLKSGAIDMVNVLAVEPGYGGRQMQPAVLDKVSLLRRLFPQLDIQIDGGVTCENAMAVVAAGANVLVAGTAVFKAPAGPAAAIAALRNALLTAAQ